MPRSSAFRDPFRFWLLTAWFALLALCGGASRADEPSQVLVRIAAILVIAISLWAPRWDRLADYRALLIFAAAVVGLMVLQLIPLPPALWSALPGRAFYADIAQTAGVGDVWRPISVAPDLTLDSLLGLLAPLATLIAVGSMSRHDRRGLLALPIVVALASAVVGLAQLTDVVPAFYLVSTPDAAIGLFANRNHQAVFLAMALVFLGAASPRLSTSREWRRSEPAITAALALFLLVTIVAVGSRAGLLAGVVALGFGALLYAQARESVRPAPRPGSPIVPPRRGWLIALPAAALAMVALGLAVFGSRAVSVDRLLAGGQEVRVERLGTLIDMAWTFFPIGAGIGTFAPAFFRFESDDQLKLSYANQAHNEPAQLAIEAGAGGLALLLLVVGWWAWRTLALWRVGDNGTEAAAGRAGSIVVLIAGFASLADYPLRTPLFGSLVLVAAMLMAAGRAPLVASSRNLT